MSNDTSLLLPTQVSPDGAELWDWAGRLAEHTQRVHKRREVRAAIVSAESTCGNCTHWMRKSCPREVHSNNTGRWTGPSMASTKCALFVITASDAARVAKLRAELAELSEATP